MLRRNIEVTGDLYAAIYARHLSTCYAGSDDSTSIIKLLHIFVQNMSVVNRLPPAFLSFLIDSRLAPPTKRPRRTAATLQSLSH
jgi:hypothetical protein